MSKFKNETATPAQGGSELRIAAGRRHRTRQALLEAGERLISGSSLSAVSVDDIVAAANVAKGTFYNHFIDKDALFLAIVERVRAEVRSRILEETRELDDPARKMARGFCVGLCYQLSHRDRVVFLMHSRFTHHSVYDRVNVGITSFVSEGIISGRFRLATAEAGVLLMHGLSGAAYSQTMHERDLFATVARAQQLTAILLRGLGLLIDEADIIAAQEADLTLRSHLHLHPSGHDGGAGDIGRIVPSRRL